MLTFESLSLFWPTLSGLALFFASIFGIFFVLLPRKRVNSYQRDGVTTFFYPILGFFAYLQQNLKAKNDIMASLKEATKTILNPKFFITHVKSTPCILLQDPKYIKEFLLKPNNYQKIFFIDMLKPLAGNGLVSSEGETWKRHRKIISASFNFEFLKTNVSVIQKTAKEFFEKLKDEDYENYSVINRVQEITGEVIGRIFFGENLNGYTFEGKPLTLALAAFDPLVVFLGPKVLNVPFFPKYRSLLQRANDFRKVCLGIIKDRKSKPLSRSDDLLTSLLATQTSHDFENRFSLMRT